MPMSVCWSLEPFMFTFGLISSMICCGIEARSRSRRRLSRRTTNSNVEDIVGMDIVTPQPDAPQPTLNLDIVTSRPDVPEPPLTVYTEHRYHDLPPLPSRLSISPSPSSHRSPTSPVSSRDTVGRFSPPSIEAKPSSLRSQSLPAKRRRRRHHHSSHRSFIAPFTFTPTVTLQEAPHHDDSSSSSPARPMASSVRPPIRTPPFTRVNPIHHTSKPHSAISEHHSSHTLQSCSVTNARDNTTTRTATSKPATDTKVTTVSDSEYTYVYPSSSDESRATQDKSVDKTPSRTQVRHPLQLTRDAISQLHSLDTLEIQARVLMSKACESSISPSQFSQYLLDNDLNVFNALQNVVYPWTP